MKRLFFKFTIAFLLIESFSGFALAQEEPTLPEGLDEPSSSEPGLPEGLKSSNESPSKCPFAKLPLDFSGFVEGRGGGRTQNDPFEKRASVGEMRLQVQGELAWERVTLKATSDFLYDPAHDDPFHDLQEIDLESGRGFIDLREASIFLRPTDFLDVKVGRHVLTWGTGDLLFINDLFPKDWNSFFIGRDQEYLKAPSDALKAGLFTPLANLEFVYTPRFDADRYIDGKRISYYSPMTGTLVGRNAIVIPEQPERWFRDDEFAGRLYKNVKGYELATYLYRGFWKSPVGMNPESQKVTFPKLSVYGGSVRGPLGPGIGTMEVGYYASEDGNGLNTNIRNSEFRALWGYEQEVFKDLTTGFQYYLEFMDDYNEYLFNLPAGTIPRDEIRHLLTLRLTQLLLNQNLKLSLFVFFSPSDLDAYLRPLIHYKITDHWSTEIGGNIFVRDQIHTFFGQFENNSNVFGALRYSF